MQIQCKHVGNLSKDEFCKTDDLTALIVDVTSFVHSTTEGVQKTRVLFMKPLGSSHKSNCAVFVSF